MNVINESYVQVSSNNELLTIPISMIRKDINPKNFTKRNYNHYVAPAFNYMMNIFTWFTETKRLRDYSKLNQSQVIVSDDQLSDAIGCHPATADRVMQKLRIIFDLEFAQIHGDAGARIVTINNRVTEFLSIFSKDELYLYIEKYNLRNKGVNKAIMQLYKYRAWQVRTSHLKPSQKEALIVHKKRMNNYFDEMYKNNVSDEARILFVRQHQDKISGKNKEQLERIIEENKQGKLSCYWHRLLVRIHQKITMAINVMKLKKKNNDKKSHINSESNQGETVAHKAATYEAQRVPEDPELTLSDYAEIMITWNNMIGSNNIPNIQELNMKTIHAINKQVKSIGKDKLLSYIKKVPGLYKVKDGSWTMTIDSFLTDRTIGIFESNPNIQVEEEMTDWLTDYMSKEYGVISTPTIDLNSIPSLDTINELNAWWEKLTTTEAIQ